MILQVSNFSAQCISVLSGVPNTELCHFLSSTEIHGESQHEVTFLTLQKILIADRVKGSRKEGGPCTSPANVSQSLYIPFITQGVSGLSDSHIGHF